MAKWVLLSFVLVVFVGFQVLWIVCSVVCNQTSTIVGLKPTTSTFSLFSGLHGNVHRSLGYQGVVLTFKISGSPNISHNLGS